MSNYARDREYRNLADKLQHCGHWLLFRNYYTVDQVRLAKADFCKKHLVCPFCAIRRGAKYLKAYLDRLQVVQRDHEGLKAYMVTLTVKNGEDLHERFTHLRSAMRRMSQARRDHLKAPAKNRHVEAAKALGGVHSIEFKRGEGSGLWHPHVHMVWLCHETPDAEKLSKEWQSWTGDSYIVDVTPFHDQQDVVSGFLEVFKYALKFSSLPLEDNFEAFLTLQGKRLVDSFGVLRGVEVPDDLTDEPLDGLPFIEMLYRFTAGGYSLSSHRQIEARPSARRSTGRDEPLTREEPMDTHQDELPLAFVDRRPAGWAVMHDNGAAVDRPTLLALYESREDAEAHVLRINGAFREPPPPHPVADHKAQTSDHPTQGPRQRP